MNTQNILGYYGSNLDFKLDYSEFYDFELVKNDNKDDFIDVTLSYESIFNSNCLTGFTTPFQIEIGQNFTGDTCDFTIRRRTEKGWTTNFVFNRETLPWSSGSVFYYWGISGETNPSNYLDNNLSFQFTDDAKIKWVSYRYSGDCDSTSGYTESSYISSGITETLCDNGTSNDFVITITFERNLELKDCDIENQGGQNDLILGPHAVSYTNILWDPTGDTTNFFSGSFKQVANQTTSGYTITNEISDWITGGTITNNFTESLNKKWWNERNKRLGTLKIYLNGSPIYKIKNWEEIIPSQRSSENLMVQIWGGGTDGSDNLHIGESGFNLKQFDYYNEPLNFLIVKNNVKTLKNTYSIVECNEPCVDTSLFYVKNGLLDEDMNNLLTEDNDILLY